MVIWALYVIAVSALVGAAAFCAERAARLRHAPPRWYWMMAILASIVVPAVVASISVQPPSIVGNATSRILVLRDMTSIPVSPQQWIRASHAQINHWRSFDSLLKSAWLLSSSGMLLILQYPGIYRCGGICAACVRPSKWTAMRALFAAARTWSPTANRC